MIYPFIISFSCGICAHRITNDKINFPTCVRNILAHSSVEWNRLRADDLCIIVAHERQ